MSSPPPARPASSGDALRAFRDRAAVILAEERGFTPQCRVKLARVAKELGLTDTQAEDAIRSLKEGARPRQTEPLVEKFRQRLRKDLSGRHKTVIGPEIEARVIESARRKYGLDEPTVREVLAEVAAELGLRHITGDQAVQLYLDTVDQAVGDATWLAREAWDRLRSAGENWGLSFEEAEDLVEQKIAANRRAYAAGRFWSRFVIGGSIATVVLVAAVLVALYMKNQRSHIGASASSPSVVSAEPERKKPPTQPAWWDVDLAVAMATARREIKDVAGLYDSLRSEEGTARKKAYEQLLDVALKIDPDSSEHRVVIELLSGCHALDPDEACAARLREALLALVPSSEQGLTRTTAIYQRAFWGVDSAMTLQARQGMPTARAETLAAAISAATGARVVATGQSEESRRGALAALTKTLYRHLTTKGPSQPDEAAELQLYLTTQASQWLTPTEIERLNVTFLVAMLTGAEKAWKTFEPLMQAMADSRDPLVVLELLGAYRKVENRVLQQALGAMLVRRTGARPRSDDPRQVARAVRQALGASGVAVAQSAEERWEDLRAAAEPVLSRSSSAPADRVAMLAETVELANLATQAMALAQGEPGFAIFDELTREPDAKEKKTEERGDPLAPGESGFRAPPVKKRPLSQQEKQLLARAIGQLADFEGQSPIVRANALRIVAARVPQASDLTYDQATIVARYLLAAKADEELESILTAVGTLRSWKQVRLALADRISESKLTLGQRERVFGALLGSFAPPAGAAPQMLRQLLLRDVLADLEAGEEGSFPAGDGKQRSFVEGLAEAYRQRARVLAVPAAEYQSADSPARALEILVNVLGRRTETPRHAAGKGEGPHLAQKLETVRYLGPDDPQRTALLQRLQLELIAQQISASKPKESAAAVRILEDLSVSDAAASDLLVQIRDGERATLAMWMRYAEQ